MPSLRPPPLAPPLILLPCRLRMCAWSPVQRRRATYSQSWFLAMWMLLREVPQLVEDMREELRHIRRGRLVEGDARWRHAKKRDRSQAVVPPGGFGTSSRHKLTEKETSDHASDIFGRRHFVWLWIVALQIQTRPRDTGTTATCASCRFRRTRRSHASSSCHSRRRPHA